jgi:hypothetical protein
MLDASYETNSISNLIVVLRSKPDTDAAAILETKSSVVTNGDAWVLALEVLDRLAFNDDPNIHQQLYRALVNVLPSVREYCAQNNRPDWETRDSFVAAANLILGLDGSRHKPKVSGIFGEIKEALNRSISEESPGLPGSREPVQQDHLAVVAL